MKENEVLKKKSNKLNEIVLKFTNGQKNIEKLLSSQKFIFDKRVLGHKTNLKQKYYTNCFIRLPPLVIIRLFVIIAMEMVK